jgi:fatty-acyl-CoA synthase
MTRPHRARPAPGGATISSVTTHCTIGRWLCDRARVTPDRRALECDGAVFTYRQLHASSHRTATALARTGSALPPGERVAVLAGNCPEYVALLFACAHRALAVVPLNWRQSPHELAYQLSHSRASLLVADGERMRLASDAVTAMAAGADPHEQAGRGEHAGGGGALSLVPMDELVTLSNEATPAGELASEPPTTAPLEGLCPAPPAELHDGSPLLLVYTSGTTGRPKGAVLTHANVFWTNLVFDRLADVTSHDVVLQVLPQFHVGGWNCQPLLAWWKGASVVLERSFDPARALGLVADRGVTTMMGVPATYQAMAALDAFGAADLSSLRYVLVGGAPMPESLLRRWQERGVRILQGYGLTEAAPNVLCLPAEEARRHLGFAGVPYPHLDVALADPDAGELVHGPAEGELLVRGPSVFAGYWDDPGATALAMRGGWLHTGDVAVRDAEGFYRIKDRLKDMYISGGENVYPAEVETVLSSHPNIVEAAVVGVPDDRWGEAGMAVVVVAAGTAMSEDEVRAWCAGKLGRYKVPRDVRFIDALPRSAVGKVAKEHLRDRFAGGTPQ